jgi:DnaJ like chaperone protein
MFIAVRQVVSGFAAAKAEVDPFQKTNFESSNYGDGAQRKRDSKSSLRQERALRSLRPWHEVLEVSPNATLDQIKTAYRQKISLYHPDRVAGLGQELRELAEVHAKCPCQNFWNQGNQL